LHIERLTRSNLVRMIMAESFDNGYAITTELDKMKMWIVHAVI